MITLYGKIYIAEKHFPWTIQKSPDWNYKRGNMFIREMIHLQKTNYSPYVAENIEIVIKLNKILESEKNL